MKFSIITCTHNSAKYIKDNIDSIKKQSFQDYEHIFIDGLSNDSTPNILELYRNENPDKIRIFKLAPNGISDAMNRGVVEARGQYLIHLHSDDFFQDENVLSDVNQYLERYNYPDWIFCKELHINNKESLGVYPKFDLYKSDSRFFWSSYLLGMNNYIRHQTVFIKKDVFDRYGLFRPDLKCVMDVEMWLRIKNKTRWLFFDRATTTYRHHEEARSTGKNFIRENDFEYYNIHKEYLSAVSFLIFKVVNKILKIKNFKKS
jgi:glycosyltransferase involved in cell wall biosynthesis